MELEISALVNIKIICNSLLTISAIFFYFLLKTLLIIVVFICLKF